MSTDLGIRLKTIRQIYGLSQRELAKRAGVTNATISLIEQDKVSPSVGSLRKVLEGIPISLSEFFALDLTAPQRAFYRANELTLIARGDVAYAQIGENLSRRRMQILHERYAPGADTGKQMLRHDSEEGGIVVRGRIELTVGGEISVLEAGDGYYFDSRLPHRFRNVGDDEAEIVSACTPPSF
ncbi:XRE family transcriptional regulator [Tistrella bauzanensis]|uniref:XRE family transcriptional regulator n=1 Tax=Tistrella bauzanensis TaxID=657419 RepID=A0ABQ1IA42_9PROT|nr:cupin domain-containing protein [Tistrella bauzanensis]GGB28557.1 XRE family transcriptional regulator [Tistrella bauzanensis]